MKTDKIGQRKFWNFLQNFGLNDTDPVAPENKATRSKTIVIGPEIMKGTTIVGPRKIGDPK